MGGGAIITGLGMHVPDNVLTNADLERIVDTNDEWIVSRTGIRERRIVDEKEGTSHLAVRAGEEALRHAGVAAEDIDLIIVATSTPDLTFPPTAALVQSALQATRASAFDMNAVCSGFLQAYITAAQFIQSGAYERVLVIGADTLSRLVDYKDRSTCILFGDGAGAVVLQRGTEQFGLLDFTMHAEGDKAGFVYAPRSDSPPMTLERIGALSAEPTIKQDGQAVFKKAVSSMVSSIKMILERNDLVADDIRLLVPHQANWRIMKAVARGVGMDEARVANCIAQYGNTSAATIPLALHKWYHTEGLEEGDLVVFTAFASGLLWGAALLRWGAI